MSECDRFDPDNVFKRFKLIEFPLSFVGLSTERCLDVETNLSKSAYLKTMCDGSLLKFDDAREISPTHRAFCLAPINDTTIQITFKPTNECICNAKNPKRNDNRFVFDLRLIQVDGLRCCYNEVHAEIGRYYISGQFEYCKLSHYPKVIDFGDIVLNTQVTKHVRIKNESKFIATKIECVKLAGFNVLPSNFVIPPNSSKRISITVKATSLKIKNTLSFKVRNPHNMHDDTIEIVVSGEITEDHNFIHYSINCKANIIYLKKIRNEVIESLHKLTEPDIKYTFIDEAQLYQQEERKKKAFKQLQVSKSCRAKKPIIEKFCTDRDKCHLDLPLMPQKENMFCKEIIEHIDTYALFDVLFLPYEMDFGKIALGTYGEQKLLIKNNTRFNITIQLLKDAHILYTDKKYNTLSIKITSYSKIQLTILCEGCLKGLFTGTFEYVIDNKFRRKYPYCLVVGNPALLIQEKIIKFGMITSEGFITSVPVRIYNYFNIPVEFKWDELHSDVPFDIIPSSGVVPQHSCKICDVLYICKPTKTKTHEVDLIFKSNIPKNISIELCVITRKLSIKFLQQAVVFKDIALNIETIERVKLENSSREIATFYVVEPLIPGFTIEPMSGNIRPKMVITFEMIVKISCVLEFSFEVIVKINNKENISIPVSGNVVEPKISIHPKNIYMTRIPCNMITYVPVTFQNISTLRTEVQVLNTGDENIFDVYTAQGNEKLRIFEFFVEGGQTKTVFVKVLDIFRREYDMYIPFKINGLLGPPDGNSWSTELHHYIGEFEAQYENNPRVRIKSLNKDISFCRIIGVITVPWVQFSTEKFEIEYDPSADNQIEFTMTNISKYYLHVTILTTKLSPIFTLDVCTEENLSIITENNIKFELDRGKEAAFTVKFHPKMHGRFVSTAVLFLDKHMTTPFYNLTFIGKRQNPVMTPSTHRILFPPCYTGTSIARTFTISMGFIANIDEFSCMSKEDPNLSVSFLNADVVTTNDHQPYTLLTVEIKVSCEVTYMRHILLSIIHECGSGCEIEINFCFTYCSLTLHTRSLVKPDDDPYPYFPTNTQSELYDYMVTCTQFLEKWMFQQGFRRDLYPVIPDTFHAISTFLSAPSGAMKSKGITVTFLNFMRRIAGPMMKHVRKASSQSVDESYKCVIEIHDTYKEILHLLRSRGADLWVLQAKFLLSYDQFVVYSEYVAPKSNADILLTQELLEDLNLFHRLSKQSWVDFILQSYKVFVIDSCFFDCICVSSQQRDIVKVLIDWFNEQIRLQHNKLRGKDKIIKEISNITTDLSDGIALASAILTYCPFLADQFTMFSEVENNQSILAVVVNNACLIIEAMNILRLYFPLNSKDFLEPNFLQMLFLSVHLYVVLPMFKPRDTVRFNPPLLRSSTRHVGVCSSSQESLTFNYIILNNTRNNFTVEKGQTVDNGKKIILNVKYIANFVNEENCILLVHGYNKTRIFDTYIVFLLKGCVGMLNPFRKCKVTGPLYRPNKIDILVGSPFALAATFKLHITDIEPSVPADFNYSTKPKCYVRRLNLIDTDVTLQPVPKESSAQDNSEQKVYFQLMCLSTQVGTSWVWFRSEIGEFFVRVTTQPRWDIAVDTLQAKVQSWPMDPCSCGEACECYRTTILMIPHRNELMVKALRYALLEHASDIMIHIFDELIETTTGKLILSRLLSEDGTNMSEVQHILNSEVRYRISSKSLIPRLDQVVLEHHTDAILPLPVTIPARDKSEKYSIIFTSDCGLDIRTYRILFIEPTSCLSTTTE